MSRNEKRLMPMTTGTISANRLARNRPTPPRPSALPDFVEIEEPGQQIVEPVNIRPNRRPEGSEHDRNRWRVTQRILLKFREQFRALGFVEGARGFFG